MDINGKTALITGASSGMGTGIVNAMAQAGAAVILLARRKSLLRKAHELGGSERVNKWINLHSIGEKKNQLIRIAKEAEYI